MDYKWIRVFVVVVASSLMDFKVCVVLHVMNS